MIKSRAVKITTITSSIIIIGTIWLANYYKDLKDENLFKMAIQKENYQVSDNPYFLNNEIMNKRDSPDTILVFMKNKSDYYAAQRALDSENYEVGLSYLEKINLKSFDVLKYDLRGDIFYISGNHESAKESYKIALSKVSKKNKYLKESIFSKYQKTFQ